MFIAKKNVSEPKAKLRWHCPCDFSEIHSTKNQTKQRQRQKHYEVAIERQLCGLRKWKFTCWCVHFQSVVLYTTCRDDRFPYITLYIFVHQNRALVRFQWVQFISNAHSIHTRLFSPHAIGHFRFRVCDRLISILLFLPLLTRIKRMKKMFV